MQESVADDMAQRPERRRSERRPFRQQRRPEERVRLLGETVDLMRLEEVLAHIEQCIEAGRRSLVANHNLHSLYLIRRTPVMRRMYDLADVVQVDSTPLIHFGRLLGMHSRPFHRSTYLDWRDHFWSLADRKGWRVFFLGGAEGVAATAGDRLAARYPGMTLTGMTGYFDAAKGSADNARILDAITAFRPDVIFVGMGMPRQEAWIADHFDQLPNAVILPVGAAFDYEAGVQKAAPRWMGTMGLEWLFRLAADPRRLFTRYCVEPWFLIGPAFQDIREAWRRRKAGV